MREIKFRIWDKKEGVFVQNLMLDTDGYLYEPFKENIQDALEMLYIWYRDVLIYKSTGDGRFIIERGRILHIKEAAARLTAKSILNKLDAILKTRARLKANANFTMTMDILMMEIIA